MGKFGASKGLQFEMHKEHIDLTKHLKKTMYYGKMPKTDRTSLPVTDIAVEFFSKMSPDKLGKIDMYYAANMSRNCCISPCSMVLALVYLKRLKNKNPDYLLQVSSSELFLISVMIASKFMNDEGEGDEVFNDEWANSANLDLLELNLLERQFLSAIDWEVFCDTSTFADMLRKVETRIAIHEGRKRGWLSYTDVGVLLNGKIKSQSLDVLEKMIKVTLLCCAAYAVSVVALVMSVGTTLQVATTLLSPATSISTKPTANLSSVTTVDQPLINDSACVLLDDELLLATLERSEGLLPVCERCRCVLDSSPEVLLYYRPNESPPVRPDREKNWTLHPLYVR